VGTYRLYFAGLAERETPGLLHCLAGKDRTGVAAALLHALLGVHSDDIMGDYLLTNSAGNIDRRIDAGARHIRNNYGERIEEAAIRTLMSVHPDYLQTSLGRIVERHGSIERYSDEVLGVDPCLLERLKARLII
jgi:protein tyrosine/serine phosphatase